MNPEACRRLKGENPDKNINLMGSKFALKVCKVLDGNPSTCNWEEFLAIASELRPWYNRSLTDIAILSSHNGSKAQKLLWDLGSSGMVVHELVYILDRLRLENLLIDIKEREPIEIVLDLERSHTVDEGSPLTLMVEGIGFPYPRYQWFKVINGRWSELRAETSKTFSIQTTSLADSGLYCCRIGNGNQRCHVKFSSKVHVHVSSRDLTSVLNNLSVREAVEDLDSTEMSPKSINSVPETPVNPVSVFKARAKVALLIGNSEYPEWSLHGIPENDVLAMTDILERLNFKVFSYLNLSKSEIKATIHILVSFINSVGPGVYVMFCYFGHGFEESRSSFIVPSDVKEDYGVADCVSADFILRELEMKTNSALIVMTLDMCRQSYKSHRHNHDDKSSILHKGNGFRREGNTVVLYSTSTGMLSYQDKQHGLLAKYFIQRIQQHSDVTDVMKEVLSDMRIEMKRHGLGVEQIPQFSSTLNEKRSFRDCISYSEDLTRALEKWRCVFEPPPSRHFFLPGANLEMNVQFNVKALNTLLIQISIHKTKDCDDTDLSGLIINLYTYKHIIIQRVTTEQNNHKFVIKDIQKLEADLIIRIFVYNQRTRMSIGDIEVNLESPLIAAIGPGIWKNKF